MVPYLPTLSNGLESIFLLVAQSLSSRKGVVQGRRCDDVKRVHTVLLALRGSPAAYGLPSCRTTTGRFRRQEKAQNDGRDSELEFHAGENSSVEAHQ
jgi:hypothetical protein